MRDSRKHGKHRRPQEIYIMEQDPRDQRRKCEDRNKAASQIVGDFPPVNLSDAIILFFAVGVFYSAGKPGNRLPITARPSVHSVVIGCHLCRETVRQLNIAGERAAQVCPLQQVVRQNGVLGKTVIQTGQISIEVNDPLSGEAACPE